VVSPFPGLYWSVPIITFRAAIVPLFSPIKSISSLGMFAVSVPVSVAYISLAISI
jgi:hypothetical protein